MKNQLLLDECCECCGWRGNLSVHHLKPMSVIIKENGLSKNESHRHKPIYRIGNSVLLCYVCHKILHWIVPDNEALAREYRTIDKIRDVVIPNRARYFAGEEIGDVDEELYNEFLQELNLV